MGKRSVIRLGMAAAVLLLAACAVRQEASINRDGSGSIRFRVELTPFFVDYIRDMAEVSGEKQIEQGRIFDLEGIRRGFEERPGVKVTRLASPKPEVLEGELAFRDVEAVFRGESQLTQAGVISFTRRGNAKTLRLYLDRKNFAQVERLLPILDNPLFASLGPRENEGVTEAEYLDMMAFAMGDEGPAGIKSSAIELKVNVQGRLVSQSGGQPKDGGVLFRVPLIRVLLLDTPLDYSLVFE